jgi:Mrp family chromosome partitioning ATPase
VLTCVFFNVDRELRTVVIVSPAPGDGKTTIARYLAEAAARLGSRVMLLETDRRSASAMDVVLERAKSGYDLVVIDTPPLTAVSADGAFSSEDLAPTRSAF